MSELKMRVEVWLHSIITIRNFINISVIMGNMALVAVVEVSKVQ